MPKANSRNQDCHEGACEVTFKPIQAARRSFQNLKALAGDVMEKAMAAVPNSRLLLLSPPGAHRARVLEILQEFAIAAERIEFVQIVGGEGAFSASGASCPSAENVIWLPRSSIKSPQCLSARYPERSIAWLSALMIFLVSSALKSSA